MSTPGRRAALLLEFAETTRALRTAAQAGEVGHVARALCARQRLIDEARRFDAPQAPLSSRERRMLEQAAEDERLANEALLRQRTEILGAFRTLAKARRAHGGYASVGGPGAPAQGRRV